MRRSQSVRGGVWYMGGRKRRRQKQTWGFFALTAFVGALLGAVGGKVIKKIFGGSRRRKRAKYV